MAKPLAVLVLAGIYASTLLAEVVQIKRIDFDHPSEPMAGELQFHMTIFTTDNIWSNDNPFLTAPVEEFINVWSTRVRQVVEVEGTMIIDHPYTTLDFYGQPQTSYTSRPFFYNVDLRALEGLTDWAWNGDTTINLGSPLPASGTFNQAEQRFYVSDGRQYQVVPEPSSLFLLFAGGAVLMAARRRK